MAFIDYRIKQILLFLLIITGSNFYVSGQGTTFKPLFSTGLDTTMGHWLLGQCSRATPKNISTFWMLSQSDIDTLEKNFTKIYTVVSKECCGQGQKVSNLSDFGFQYIGVVIKGRKYVYVNAFIITKLEEMKAFNKDFDPMKSLIMACDGGSDFWGALFDIKRKKFSALNFNGNS